VNDECVDPRYKSPQYKECKAIEDKQFPHARYATCKCKECPIHNSLTCFKKFGVFRSTRYWMLNNQQTPCGNYNKYFTRIKCLK
jgi:hypothetical protein